MPPAFRGSGAHLYLDIDLVGIFHPVFIWVVADMRIEELEVTDDDIDLLTFEVMGHDSNGDYFRIAVEYDLEEDEMTFEPLEGDIEHEERFKKAVIKCLKKDGYIDEEDEDFDDDDDDDDDDEEDDIDEDEKEEF